MAGFFGIGSALARVGDRFQLQRAAVLNGAMDHFGRGTVLQQDDSADHERAADHLQETHFLPDENEGHHAGDHGLERARDARARGLDALESFEV